MHLPKMIIFDYGHTLVYEPGFDGTTAARELLRHCVKNPRGISAEELSDFADKLHERYIRQARTVGVDLNHRAFQRLLCEYLGIELNLSQSDMERIYWDSAAPGSAMQGIEDVLDYMSSRGIRSGVISNISFSEEALRARLSQLLPKNRFEFIIASGEYMVRKPDPIIFKLALQKAGLSGYEVWYCGDSAKFDVSGAASAGIFPVWYQNELECYYRAGIKEDAPDCEFIRIKNWSELIAILDCFD